MKTADFLRQHNACQSGAKWALSISDDMADVWDMMVKEGKHEWLIWTATRPGVFSGTVVRKLACRFIRETPLHDGRTVWDLLTDERSRMAVEVAERYAEGKATKKELADAASAAARAARAARAATAYAADAAADASSFAAYASSFAAYAAARAARAAVYAAYDAYYATDAAVRAARAAAFYDASADAYDGYTAADAAACTAQVRMFAELGNPFRKKEPSTVKQWSKHYIARVLRFAEKNDGDWNEECPTEEKGLEVPVYGDADLIAAAPKMLATLESVCAEMDHVLKMIRLTKGRGYSSDQALLEMHEFIKGTILKVKEKPNEH